MTPTKPLTLTLALVITALALTAGTATAEEKTKMLPESGVTFTTTGGVWKWETVGNLVVECTKVKGSGTIESANLGKYSLDFEECTATGGTKCTGEGEASGVILDKGIYHFWLGKETIGEKATLVGSLAYLAEETKFSCVILGISVKVIVLPGCFAALATPLNTLTAVTKDTFAQIGNGIQLITKVLPKEKTTEIECILLSNKSGGAFEQTSVVSVLENLNFHKEAVSVTVLLMNPEAKE